MFWYVLIDLWYEIDMNRYMYDMIHTPYHVISRDVRDMKHIAAYRTCSVIYGWYTVLICTDIEWYFSWYNNDISERYVLICVDMQLYAGYVMCDILRPDIHWYDSISKIALDIRRPVIWWPSCEGGDMLLKWRHLISWHITTYHNPYITKHISWHIMHISDMYITPKYISTYQNISAHIKSTDKLDKKYRQTR